MISYNNSAPKAVNNVGQFGATEGSIGAYKSAAEYAADAKYWALLSQTKYSSIEEILAEVERLYAQGRLLEEDIKQLKDDFETQQQILLGLIQSTNTAIDNTNAATELSKEATQEVLAQLDIISNMTVQTTLLPPGSMATGSYDNSTGVFSFGIPEGQPGRDGTDGTISDIGSVPIGTPVTDDYGFYVDKDNGGLYRAGMSDIANLVPSVRSISINGGAEQMGAVAFNSVSSFNARTGDVVSQVGDYEVGQITGAAASGDNSDITSLSGLTTALSVSQGGTGATTPEASRTNLGLGSVSVENVVPLTKGGTGAITPSEARTNLGLGLVSTESIVPITKGGTGSTSAENARLALVAAKSGANSDITSMTNSVTFTQPVSVADAVDATNAINLGQISSLSENTGVNLVGGASHTGTATDTSSFSTLTIRDDVYTRDNTVSIPTDGISTNSGSLYLTRNGVSYKLITSTGDFTWPSEYLTSVSDLKTSIEAVCTFGRNIDLAGSTVNLSSATLTKNVSNGTLKALSDVGSFIFVNGCRLYNVKVDCNNKAVRRAVHIPANSVNSIVNVVEICNSTGATNANGLFIDANNAQGFIVDDVYIHNITSVGNGTIGDATGPCRGIIVGTALDPEPTSTTVSSGIINNIVVRDLAPFEDCDGVVVQIYDSTANMLSAKNIVISNIHTSNVRKRAVKIQANDVTIRGVDAYCGTTDTAMYSIVSMYGTNGVAENISGRGRILNGIDCAHGFNYVRGLYLNTERTGSDTLPGIGAGLLINSGQVDAVDVYSEGAEYVVAVRDALGDTPYVKIDGIRGKGYSGVIRFQIRAGNSIGDVYLSDISATTSATNKGAVSVDFTSNQLSYLNVSGVKHIASESALPDFNLAGQVTEARFDDCVFRGGTSSIGINMVTGKLVASNISSTKTFAVAANQTTDAYITSVDGAVRLTDTTNSHLVLTRAPTLVGNNTGLVQTSYA